MVFSSIPFIFVFLPLSLAGYFVLGAYGRRMAALWLVLCSLAFYAYWSAQFVGLLLGSAAMNFLAGRAIIRLQDPAAKRATAAAAVGANLLAFAVVKYYAPAVGFLVANGLSTWSVPDIALPLGISFYTFTQIAFLLDTRSGLVRDSRPLSYLLFVTFFPHLIAGPLLHHGEITPQFDDPATYRPRLSNFSTGCGMFILGLTKKVLIADGVADYVPLAFGDPASADAFAAWMGVLAYAADIYFDFSGYSDMAIGVARMFGIRFPINFNSPYKATNIGEYWQRWHITLTKWITIYIYQPIAVRAMRRVVSSSGRITADTLRSPKTFLSLTVLPLLATMGAAGVWHGSGLQFLVFGLLHGVFLSAQRAWVAFRGPRLPKVMNWLLTFGAVLLGLVFFRADNVGSALSVLAAMAGLHGFMLPDWAVTWLGTTGTFLLDSGVLRPGEDQLRAIVPIMAALAITVLCPNTQEIMQLGSKIDERHGPGPRWAWQPTLLWAMIMAVMLFASMTRISSSRVFVYFQF